MRSGDLAPTVFTTVGLRDARRVELWEEHNATALIGLEVRAGVHTGEVEFRPDDVVGLTVSIAKRICDLADPGAVCVSRTVSDLAAGVTLREYSLASIPQGNLMR